MDGIDHEIDPRGDTVLILQNPSAPFAIWRAEEQLPHNFVFPQLTSKEPDPSFTTVGINNDLGATARETRDLGPSEVRYRVSSRHLALASPQFRAMVEGPWKEGADGPPYAIKAEDWDEEAFLHVMNIIHGLNRKVPKKLSLERLARIAVIVDYYHCHEAVEMFAAVWTEDLEARFCHSKHEYSDRDIVDRDVVLKLLLASVFQQKVWFQYATRIVLHCSMGPMNTLGLPIPLAVVESLDNRRQEAIQGVVDEATKLVTRLSRQEIGCDFECSSMMLGVLTSHMIAIELLFQPPEPPFIGYNFRDLVKWVHGFRTPSYHIADSCRIQTYLQDVVFKLSESLEGITLK